MCALGAAAERRHGPAARADVAPAVGGLRSRRRSERPRGRALARTPESDRLRHREGRLAHPRAPWCASASIRCMFRTYSYSTCLACAGAAQPEGVHGGLSGEQRAHRAALRALEDRRRPALRHAAHYGSALTSDAHSTILSILCSALYALRSSISDTRTFHFDVLIDVQYWSIGVLPFSNRQCRHAAKSCDTTRCKRTPHEPSSTAAGLAERLSTRCPRVALFLRKTRNNLNKHAVCFDVKDECERVGLRDGPVGSIGLGGERKADGCECECECDVICCVHRSCECGDLCVAERRRRAEDALVRLRPAADRRRAGRPRSVQIGDAIPAGASRRPPAAVHAAVRASVPELHDTHRLVWTWSAIFRLTCEQLGFRTVL